MAAPFHRAVASTLTAAQHRLHYDAAQACRNVSRVYIATVGGEWPDGRWRVKIGMTYGMSVHDRMASLNSENGNAPVNLLFVGFVAGPAPAGRMWEAATHWAAHFHLFSGNEYFRMTLRQCALLFHAVFRFPGCEAHVLTTLAQVGQAALDNERADQH